MNFRRQIHRRGAKTLRTFKNSAPLRLCGFFLFLACGAFAQELSPLAKVPDWSRLEQFQETITHDEFARLLDEVYAPGNVWQATIKLDADDALIAEDAAWSKVFTLRFSKNETKTSPHYWHAASALPPAKQANKPLARLLIALDPGHLGGRWARMEERWFRIGDSKPVAEGDMTLLTARILAKKLRTLGATVLFVRAQPGPLTDAGPRQLRKAALAELKRQQIRFIRDAYDGTADPIKQNSVQWESELLFYRISEIHARGVRVNDMLRPDLALCLHYNAEAWGDEKNPALTEKNHLHLLINGNYAANELALDDVRLEMLLKLLTRCFPDELAASKKVAAALAAATSLPPYEYTGGNARPVAGEPYLWTRNLLANRLYRCPTIYIEPYVMNSREVFDRVQLGDYEGTREINGIPRKSIYREYADAVADGLVDYCREVRAGKK